MIKLFGCKKIYDFNRPMIGVPTNVKQTLHVSKNQFGELEGLPASWYNWILRLKMEEDEQFNFKTSKDNEELLQIKRIPEIKSRPFRHSLATPYLKIELSRAIGSITQLIKTNRY